MAILTESFRDKILSAISAASKRTKPEEEKMVFTSQMTKSLMCLLFQPSIPLSDVVFRNNNDWYAIEYNHGILPVQLGPVDWDRIHDRLVPNGIHPKDVSQISDTKFIIELAIIWNDFLVKSSDGSKWVQKSIYINSGYLLIDVESEEWFISENSGFLSKLVHKNGWIDEFRVTSSTAIREEVVDRLSTNYYYELIMTSQLIQDLFTFAEQQRVRLGNHLNKKKDQKDGSM